MLSVFCYQDLRSRRAGSRCINEAVEEYQDEVCAEPDTCMRPFLCLPTLHDTNFYKYFSRPLRFSRHDIIPHHSSGPVSGASSSRSRPALERPGPSTWHLNMAPIVISAMLIRYLPFRSQLYELIAIGMRLIKGYTIAR